MIGSTWAAEPDGVWLIDRRRMWPPRGRIPLPISPSIYETCRLCMLQATFDASSGCMRRSSTSARLGAAFHETLGRMDRIAHAASPREARAEAVAAFRSAVAQQQERAEQNPRERGSLWPEAQMQRMEIALAQVAGRRAAQHPHAAPVPPPADHGPTAVEKTLRAGAIVGRPDRVERTATGAVIVEYKTGALDGVLLARYRRQCLAYAWLWHATTDEWPIAYHLINPVGGTEVRIPVEPTEARAVVEDMERIVGILSASIAPDQQASPGPHCQHCQYRPWCAPFWAALTRHGAAPIGEGVYRRLSLQVRVTTNRGERAGKLFMEVQTRGGPATVEADAMRFPHLRTVEPGVDLRLIDARWPSTESAWFALDDRSEAFVLMTLSPSSGEDKPIPIEGVDIDLFESHWHPLIATLARLEGIDIDAGSDVVRDGRVVGSYLAEVVATVPDGGARGNETAPHAHAIYLVEGDAMGAEHVRMALQERGDAVVMVQCEETDATVAAVRDALGRRG